MTFAGGPSPSDPGGAPLSLGTGSTFADPPGNPASWVMFRPDGVPVAFTTACNIGGTGSGGGGVYVTNGSRDYGVVLSPLGGVKLMRFDRGGSTWVN